VDLTVIYSKLNAVKLSISEKEKLPPNPPSFCIQIIDSNLEGGFGGDEIEGRRLIF